MVSNYTLKLKQKIKEKEEMYLITETNKLHGRETTTEERRLLKNKYGFL
jgi:hypothetical protein